MVGMARVGKTLALVAFTALAAAPDAFAQAQAQSPAQNAKPAEAPPKRSVAAKKAKAGQDGAAATDAAAKKAEPGAVEKALDSAQKSLDTNKPDQAVNQVNSLISVGGLDSRAMARALAIRGIAYRKQGKPAQAISDLQSALHLRNGLNDSERAAATEARAAAYREAGLGEAPALAAGKPATPTGKGAPAATQAAQSTPIATAAVAPRPEPAAQPQQQGGIGGFFSNIFGGSSGKPAAEPSPVKAPADAAVSSWSTASTPPTGAKAAAVVAKPPKPEAPAAAAKGGGHHRIQLTAVKTREEAQAMAERVKREHGREIGGRSYEIDETRFGGATFYRPRFSAFQTVNEAKSLCATLRGKGIDCLASE
jgi:hypothetical protein